ncbi:TPA: hemagglutinin repeat-containing protein, partial [Neisseria meningitidis]
GRLGRIRRYLGRKQPKSCVGVSAVGRERNFAKVSIFLSTSSHSNQTKAVHRHTHVGSMVGTTTIRSGGDTTLKGAQLIGKGIQADPQLQP